MNLILASASPRRKEILSKLTPNFEVIVSGEDEDINEKNPYVMVEKIAYKKGIKVFEKTSDKDKIIISADTIVVVDDIVLGKPHSKEEAYRMVKMLQGRSHKVLTGVLIKSSSKEKIFVEETKVNIKDMTEEDINEYINTQEPYDKAGSYAIQGIFSKYISSIEGDYYNVMGLPLEKVKSALEEFKK